ncbi:hypothetical protein ACO0LO_19510 [Undibacterium sp. TJN25]|uniref:hypothetical protein n=1 Tax=Undibacterium sp. TJN25 TaxID=3413056 RepID=UPI003BF02B3A
MRRLLLTLTATIIPCVAFAQEPTANALTIATALNNSQSQWVFNHICVPSTLLEGNRFNRSDFADAYIVVSGMRWQSALDALSKNDERESMKSLALILHGIIDAYWPGRVERDAAGAITNFRDCEQLGNLKGMLQEEARGGGPTGPAKEEATRVLTEVIRNWKERKPFEEVEPLLKSGPMNLNAKIRAEPLGVK